MPQEFEKAHAQSGQMPQSQTQDRQDREAGQNRQAASAAAQSNADALDAVLDEIESTLATNAEEYVSSFVQKGGQ